MTYINFLALSFLIAWAAIQNLLLIMFFLVVVFTWRFGGVFLIPLAMFVDGYFGAFSTLPLFSIGAVVWYIVSELIRPYLYLL